MPPQLMGAFAVRVNSTLTTLQDRISLPEDVLIGRLLRRYKWLDDAEVLPEMAEDLRQRAEAERIRAIDEIIRGAITYWQQNNGKWKRAVAAGQALLKQIDAIDKAAEKVRALAKKLADTAAANKDYRPALAAWHAAFKGLWDAVLKLREPIRAVNAAAGNTFAARDPLEEVAQTAQVKVYKVLDGDTFEGVDRVGTRQRLASIDAPEAGTDVGDQATAVLTDVLKGQLVNVETEVDTKDQDNRTVLYASVIYKGKRIDPAILLLAQGLARTFIFFPNVRRLLEYARIEREAQLKRVGIWK